MAKYERILLATDFSGPANRARAEAVRLARRHHAELHVLYVDVIALQGVGTYADPALPEHVHGVEQVSMKAFPGNPVNYDKAVFEICRDTSEAAGILRRAREMRADLIVVGTHGRGALAEFVFGSVAQQVARAAEISVLVVGDVHRDGARPACILSPVDFTPASRDALAHAARIAAVEKLSLVALQVVDFDHVTQPAELEIGERERLARAALEDFVEGARLPVKAETLVTIGAAAADIARVAAELHAAMIVMSPSHHSVFEQLMRLGSVGKSVIRAAPCPVLVHRAAVPPVVQRAAA